MILAHTGWTAYPLMDMSLAIPKSGSEDSFQTSPLAPVSLEHHLLSMRLHNVLSFWENVWVLVWKCPLLREKIQLSASTDMKSCRLTHAWRICESAVVLCAHPSKCEVVEASERVFEAHSRFHLQLSIQVFAACCVHHALPLSQRHVHPRQSFLNRRPQSAPLIGLASVRPKASLNGLTVAIFHLHPRRRQLCFCHSNPSLQCPGNRPDLPNFWRLHEAEIGRAHV